MKFFPVCAVVAAFTLGAVVPGMAQTASNAGGVFAPVAPIQGSFADGASGPPRINALSLFSRSLPPKSPSVADVVLEPHVPMAEERIEPVLAPPPPALVQKPVLTAEAPAKPQPQQGAASTPDKATRAAPVGYFDSPRQQSEGGAFLLALPIGVVSSPTPAPAPAPAPAYAFGLDSLLPTVLTSLPAVGQTNQSLGCVGTAGSSASTGCATLQAGGGFNALAIPEPGVLLLIGSGLMALAIRRRRSL